MKKPIHFFLLGAFMLFPYSATFAAGLKDAPVVFRSGNWKVLRTTDTMTDKVDCTGIYKENYGIQLTSDDLYITVRGGPQSVTLRFGDKPARSLRLAAEMEKKINTVIVSSTDFSELLGSDRLRLQVSTLVRGIFTEDLDLTGIRAALDNINAGCPARGTLASDPKAEATPTSACSEVVVGRMKAQGLKENQIAAICK